MARKSLYKIETNDCGSYHVVATDIGEATEAVRELLGSMRQYLSKESRNVVGTQLIDMELGEDKFGLKEACVEGASLIIV